MAQRPQMLQGFRVLDFTHLVAGPTCTRILGEMGAEVIKVEPAPGGDRVRGVGIRRGGQSTYFFQHNHGKKSLALDFKKPRARELLRSMVPKFDVLVENYAPGAIGRMGFGYPEVSKMNPSIVMCSVSMAGQTGPLSFKPGFDYIGQAYAGITELIGDPDRPPAVVTMAIGDVSTGVAAAMAVGFALLNRIRTNEGCYIDASIIDTYFHMHELNVPLVAIRPERYEPNRSGSLHPTLSPCGIYEGTGGNIYISVMPHQWPQLVAAMEMPELASDARFTDERQRLKNKVALKEVIERWLKSFDSLEKAVEKLDEHRVACGPVLKLSEAMAHPHLKERKTVREVSDPALGKFAIPGMPVKFSNWPDRTDVAASRLGEDNDSILQELAGLSSSEIAALYEQGVLVRDPSISNSQEK